MFKLWTLISNLMSLMHGILSGLSIQSVENIFRVVIAAEHGGSYFQVVQFVLSFSAVFLKQSLVLLTHWLEAVFQILFFKLHVSSGFYTVE